MYVYIIYSYGGPGKSNMALIDVTMVSGFEPITHELDMALQSANTVFSYYEFQDGVLSFYFDDVSLSCLLIFALLFSSMH